MHHSVNCKPLWHQIIHQPASGRRVAYIRSLKNAQLSEYKLSGMAVALALAAFAFCHLLQFIALMWRKQPLNTFTGKEQTYSSQHILNF